MKTQSNTHQGIGHLEATVINEKQSLSLRVTGTFPTNGEQPRFHYVEMDGSFNPTIKLLKLEFGELVDENGKQSITIEESYPLTSSDQYTSVQVVDDNSRTLASAIVR